MHDRTVPGTIISPADLDLALRDALAHLSAQDLRELRRIVTVLPAESVKRTLLARTRVPQPG